ncbi:MAG TPA: hypothetical protein DGG95_03630 [Cytophagales bacterium]|jgi:hypothetical protein|nr:hypothetical protein [Cytophagales bacterium]
MKNDSLKEFINKNRDGFDAHNPPETAWKNIESALPKKSEQIFLNSLVFWRAAAIVLLGVSVYLFVAKNNSKPEKQDVAALQGFNDLESYYSSLISEKMNLVNRYQTQTGLNEDEITQNLKRLEAMYQVLKEELKKRPTEDVRDALVLNLLVRIDLINQQLNKLDRPEQKSI